MSFKRTFLIMAFSISFISLVCSVQKIDKNQKLDIEFTAIPDTSKTFEDQNRLLIKTILTNISSDTITFFTMSCSYPSEYTTDAMNLKIDLKDCIKNITELIKIPPHKAYERSIILIKKENNYQNTNFRIGINLMAANDIIKVFDRENKTIIFFDTSKYIYQLKDTSYKIDADIITLNNNDGSLSPSHVLANINLLWSNQISPGNFRVKH